MKLALQIASLTVALAHYGDPYKHQCEKDELAVQINGIAGKLCVPPCNADGSCPTDVPSGVTATPQCVLTSSSGGKYCALVCSGTQVCGKDASCKTGSKDGICTYDDAPPPPSSEHWKPVISPTFQAQSEAIAVGFTKDGKTGYVGGGTNGVGTQILRTTDSGVTWYPVWPDNSTKEPFNLFLSSAVKSETSAVVTGAFYQAYTTTGAHFDASKNELLDPSQDAKVTPDGNFAIAFAGNKGAGVATSKTGEFWTTHQLTANTTLFPARYGAYPTSSTWYLTGGLFPTQNSQPSHAQLGLERTRRHLSHKLAHINGRYTFTAPVAMALGEHPVFSNADPVDCSVDIGNCFSAGIFKTVDAGKTWSQVYENVNKGDNIYPNGIDCFSEDNCVAVVEGDSCRILVTSDGGKTWDEANVDTDSACSLTYVAAVSATEAWVGGGHLAQLSFAGRFWHTTDAGKTWTKEEIKGLYIFDVDMTSVTSGYAVGITASGSGSVLLKYTPS